MKINIKILFENKTVSFVINENELLESLTTLLNSHLNITDDFCFIYNKVVCDNTKTLTELDFIDDCVIYAAKKSDKPLKRRLDNQDITNALSYGSHSKKFCTLTGEELIEHTIWQNKGLVEMQHDLSGIVESNPFLFEPLILQERVEQMIKNPSIINSLYSSNPAISDIIENKPSQANFFTDSSQYQWIQDVMADSAESERLYIHYSENYKNVLDSKRYKRMKDVFEKADGTKSDDCETLETPEYDVASLGVFAKSQYVQNLTDLLTQDKELSASVLRSCPYGANISEKNIADIEAVLPQVMSNFRKSIGGQQGDCQAMYKYLRENPIEIDEETAQRLEEMTGQLPDNSLAAESSTDAEKINEMLGKIYSWVNLTPEDGGSDSRREFNKEVELLNEMGFSDNVTNLQVLAGEYGNVNKAVIKLCTE